MSFRDQVREWIDKGFTPHNPIEIKGLILKNLNQIKQLLEEDSYTKPKELSG